MGRYRPQERLRGRAFASPVLADVVCGNVQTANAAVYIVSAVLMPLSS